MTPAGSPGGQGLRLNRLPAGLLMGIPLVLASCVLGPDFQHPQPLVGDGYRSRGEARELPAAEGEAQHLTPGADIPAMWWRRFGSAHLDAQVAAALAANPSLQAAAASLRASEALLRAGSGVFYPQLTLSGSGLRERSVPTDPGSAAKPGIFNLFTLAASVSYTLDLFGGERRGVEGLQSEVSYQFYQGEAAWLALTSNVVNTSIARAAYVAELEENRCVVALQREQLREAETAYQSGFLGFAPVLALRAELAVAQASAAPLQQKIEAASHLLATLQGLSPGAPALPEVRLEELVLPRDLPLSLPAQLLRQRPDVLAAEAALHASNAAIGVASAARFPQVTLDGSAGSAATRFSGLSGSEQRFWSIGPSVSLPLFSGGALDARLVAARASEQQSQALYRQTVLSAFAQVADVLTALANDADAVQALAESRRSRCDAVALLEAGFTVGLVAWPDVLAGDVLCRQAGIARIEAVAAREQDSVALFLALGGGWWNDPILTAVVPRP